MSNHDYIVDNAVGATVRADINSALGAIATNNSSATEPATMYAYQWWADTTTGLLKQRNAANTAWLTRCVLSEGQLALLAGSASQVFSVGTATAAGHAVRLDQVGKRVAQIVTTQVGAVATGTTSIPIDDTIPQNTEGDQYMSIAITPTNINSTLEIDVEWIGGNSVAAWIVLGLFQDTTADALSSVAEYLTTATTVKAYILRHIMTAGTTSATTFKVRVGHDTGGTVTFNGAGGIRLLGGNMASHITITEYLP